MPTPPPALPGSLLPQTHTQYAHHLFTNPIFPDCTVTTLKRTFQLHRSILAPRCEFFHTCFSGLFNESSSNAVTMHDDDPDVLARMLQWLYTLEFPVSNPSDKRTPTWSADLDLWMLADKYGLTVLMEQCVDALLSTAERTAADRDGSSFKSSAEDFVDMMSTLFTEAPDREDVYELRTELLEIMAPTIARFMREVPVLEELVVEIPGFALVLVETLSKGSKGTLGLPVLTSRRRSSDSGSSAAGSRASVGSGRSGSAGSEPRVVKAYIPMNEDSEDEME